MDALGTWLRDTVEGHQGGLCVPLPSPHGGHVTSGPRKRGCRILKKTQCLLVWRNIALGGRNQVVENKLYTKVYFTHWDYGLSSLHITLCHRPVGLWVFWGRGSELGSWEGWYL